MAQTEPPPGRATHAAAVVQQETPEINQAAIDLLASWPEDGDESMAEQRET